MDPEEAAFQQNFQRNKPYAKLAGSYATPLSPQEMETFLAWVKQNKVPYNPNAKIQDYDMQGYWKDIASQGDDKTARNPNDNQRHFPDTYKTPYHKSFSNESKYAFPTAPYWNDKDQLIDP